MAYQYPCFACWFLFLSVCLSPHAFATTLVRIPPPQSALDSRYLYLVELLDMALAVTAKDFGPYKLSEASIVISETRGIKELQQGGGLVNLIWSSTSQAKEHTLLPIRIPLYRGLLGYRILLTTPELVPVIAKIQTLDELKSLIVGQELFWGDVEVYRHNGFRVVTVPGYEELFKRLMQRRFDMFPRGMNEVFVEHSARNAALPALTIEPNIFIYYPWPYYFFTARKDTTLAKRVETGLERLLQNGQFDRLFNKYYRQAIQHSRLAQRRGFYLQNPLLPAATPLSRRELWFEPDIEPTKKAAEDGDN
jgi:ABC-type amino acid transport substrate-binding protein